MNFIKHKYVQNRFKTKIDKVKIQKKMKTTKYIFTDTVHQLLSQATPLSSWPSTTTK